MIIKVKLCYLFVCQAKEVFDLTVKQHNQQSYNQRNQNTASFLISWVISCVNLKTFANLFETISVSPSRTVGRQIASHQVKCAVALWSNMVAQSVGDQLVAPATYSQSQNVEKMCATTRSPPTVPSRNKVAVLFLV